MLSFLQPASGSSERPKNLDNLATAIRPARNGILAHNDLEAILNAEPLGKFKENADKDYFEKLQQFVDLVYDKTVGAAIEFGTAAIGDVFDFLKLVNFEK